MGKQQIEVVVKQQPQGGCCSGCGCLLLFILGLCVFVAIL